MYELKNIYYPAIFHPEEAGFSVSVPDLEGCFTQGETMDEAMEMVQDAIGLMLEGLTEYPKASLPSDLSVAGNDFVVMVPFDWTAYNRAHNSRAVKKTLSLPAWLNEAAEAAHINFSKILQEDRKSVV